MSAEYPPKVVIHSEVRWPEQRFLGVDASQFERTATRLLSCCGTSNVACVKIQQTENWSRYMSGLLKRQSVLRFSLEAGKFALRSWIISGSGVLKKQ